MKTNLMTWVLAGALVAGSGVAALAQPDMSQGTQWGHSDQQASRATNALNLLEYKGYGQFSDFAKSGRMFTANVTKNGKTMQVRIDPDSQQIEPVSSTG